MAVMPKGSLGLVGGHSTRRSPENIVPLVGQSVSGTVGEGFAVSNCQPAN